MRKVLSIFLLLGMITTMTFAKMKDRKETSLIIIHHSATETGNVEIFRNFHKNERGWDDIGYHFVITNGKGGIDGKIQEGRPLEKQGAHAKGKNSASISICLVGIDKFTENQKIATILLVAKLCLDYGIEPSEKTIQAHHEKCPGPGLNLAEIIKEVKKFLDFIKEIQRLNPALRKKA